MFHCKPKFPRRGEVLGGRPVEVGSHAFERRDDGRPAPVGERLTLAREDEVVRAEKQLDVATRKHVEEIDDVLKHKEAELLEV